MLDFSIFTTAEAWISLVTLLFLEIILGVDNIVFISITSNRLPHEQQHLGRKLGLAGAMIMRVAFLCLASYLVHLVSPLFTVDLGFWSHGVSVRDLILLVGGAYLIYKGLIELRDLLVVELEALGDCLFFLLGGAFGLGRVGVGGLLGRLGVDRRHDRADHVAPARGLSCRRLLVGRGGAFPPFLLRGLVGLAGGCFVVGSRSAEQLPSHLRA